MFKLLAFLIFLLALWQPSTASITFLILVFLFEGWLVLAQFTGKLAVDTSMFSIDEIQIIKKYHLYFRYPFTSKIFSSTLSGIQMSSFLWIPWLLYNGLWTQAIIIAVNYFIAGPIAVKLNPRFFLHDAVERKKEVEFLSEMMLVDSICEKILARQFGSQTKEE